MLLLARGRTFTTRCFFFIFCASLRIQMVKCLSIYLLRRNSSARASSSLLRLVSR